MINELTPASWESSDSIQRIQSPGSSPFTIFINDLAGKKGCLLIKFSDGAPLRKIEVCQMTQVGSKKISAALSDGPGPTRWKVGAKWQLLPLGPQQEPQSPSGEPQGDVQQAWGQPEVRTV